MGKGRESCAAVDCTNNYYNCDHSFFHFPKDENRARKWAISAGRRDLLKPGSNVPIKKIICGMHFENRMFANEKRNRLSKWAVPTIFPGLEGSSSSSIVSEYLQTNTDEVSIAAEPHGSTVSNNGPRKTVFTLPIRSPSKENLRKRLKKIRYKCGQLEQTCKKLEERNREQLNQITFNEYKELTFKFCPSVELASCINAVLSQISKKPRGARFSDDFKNYCLSLYFVGPRLYRKELIDKFGLPSISTLQEFIGRIKVHAGINDIAFETLEKKVTGFQNLDKLCMICIGNMRIRASLFYATDLDRIIGIEDLGNGTREFKPARYATVIMVRGFSSNWEQPLCYFFVNSTCPDTNLKVNIFDVISRLKKIDLKVKAVVSDMGSNNIQLAKVLQVTAESPYFYHDNEKIVYLFNTPYLLNSTRNNLLKYKFEINGQTASWEFIEQFYNHDQQYPIKAAPKLTESHVHPRSFERTNTRLASEVFSNAVAAGLNLYIRFGELPREAAATQQLVTKLNNLFDLLSSSNLFGATPFQNAYKGTEKQKSFLRICYSYFDNLMIHDRQGAKVTKGMQCAEGWKITINGIMALWDTLKAEGVEYLFTQRTQTDCLDNFFESVRQQTGNCVNPTSIQFVRIFRRLFGLQLMNSGIEHFEDNTAKMIVKVTEIPSKTEQADKTTSCGNQRDVDIDLDYRTHDLLQKDFFKYIAGYLIEMCLAKHDCLICQNYSEEFDKLDDTSLAFYWGPYSHTNLNFGYMSDNSFVYFISSMETIFREYFKKVSTGNNVVRELEKLFDNISFNHPCSDFPFLYVRKLYARIRIYYTIKDIRKDFKQTSKKFIIWEQS